MKLEDIMLNEMKLITWFHLYEGPENNKIHRIELWKGDLKELVIGRNKELLINKQQFLIK